MRYWDKNWPILSTLLPELDLSVKPPRKPRRRTPTLASALKQAAKAGASVSGATIEDGRVVLTFGEPAKSESSELDTWMAKHAH